MKIDTLDYTPFLVFHAKILKRKILKGLYLHGTAWAFSSELCNIFLFLNAFHHKRWLHHVLFAKECARGKRQFIPKTALFVPFISHIELRMTKLPILISRPSIKFCYKSKILCQKIQNIFESHSWKWLKQF